MNTNNEICKGCAHDGTLENIDTQCQYCACGEKYEPKPEEAHADEQISSVRQSFEGLDEITKNMRSKMEDTIYKIQKEIADQFENALKAYLGDDTEYISYLARTGKGEVKENIPSGVKEFWLDDKKVFSVVVIMSEKSVLVTTLWHHLKDEQLSPQNFA